MTHKSIDALLASTIFLLFVLVTPNFNMVAEKFGFVQSAYAETVTPIDNTCLPTTNPWIKIKTPNGGEVYKVGEKIEVTWDSCNVPVNSNIKLELVYKNNQTGQSSTVISGSGDGWVSNDGKQDVKIPPFFDWKDAPTRPGNMYSIYIESESLETINDFSDNTFTVLSKVKNINCSAYTKPGTFKLSNEASPVGGILSQGHGPMKDSHFATITLKIDRNSNPVCINKIQLGSLTDPNLKISETSIYDSKGVLISKVPMSDWYNVPNTTYWAAWASVDIDLKAGTTQKFVIKADVLDSSLITSGLFNIGISSINFDSPGARGSSLSFGEVFSIN